jgi:hypothetical protein
MQSAPCARSSQEPGLQWVGVIAVNASLPWCVLERVITGNSGKQAMHKAHKAASLT